MKLLSRDRKNVSYFVDASLEARLHVSSGEQFEVETIRADDCFLTEQNPYFKNHEHVMSIRANPVTGPIYIENAKPGDYLKVHIDDIVLGDDGSKGYYTYVPGQGLFANDFSPFDYEPATKWVNVQGSILDMQMGQYIYSIPNEPFIGTISVAPKEEPRLAFVFGKDIVGNVDCRSIRKGSVLTMPVNVDGALLFIGDLHANQGAGELLGCAIESQGKVTLHVELVKAEEMPYYNWPTVDDDEYIGSLGFEKNDLHRANQHAFYDLIHRVECIKKVSFMDAFMFLGQCVEMDLCQDTGGFRTVLAKVKKSYLQL